MPFANIKPDSTAPLNPNASPEAEPDVRIENQTAKGDLTMPCVVQVQKKIGKSANEDAAVPQRLEAEPEVVVAWCFDSVS